MQQRYNVSDPIASGTYGTIHQCTVVEEYARILEDSGADCEAVQQMCAVKIQRHDPYFWDNFSFLREIDALMRTRAFPGTVDVLDCVLDTERECAFIVMDQYDGTLLQFINQVPFDERMRHLPVVCAQLIITMAYLDRQGIAHRDIKPSNVLVQRAPMHGHAFACHGADCGGPECADTSDEHRRYLDCMRLFAPLLSSTLLFEGTIAGRRSDPAGQHNRVQQTNEVSPDIVLCDESGTPTTAKFCGRINRQSNRSNDNLWLSGKDCAHVDDILSETGDEMLIDASDLLKDNNSNRDDCADRDCYYDDECDVADAASDDSMDSDNNVFSDDSLEDDEIGQNRDSDESDDNEYKDNDDDNEYEDDEDEVDEERSSSSRRRRRRVRCGRHRRSEMLVDCADRRYSRDFDKEKSISVSLHASDGRPRSFPGVSFMPQRAHTLHSSANGATTDGEANALLAGDLASLHRAPLAVICDFGLAKQLGPSRDTPCLVTLNFRPPEMFVDASEASPGDKHVEQLLHQRRRQQQQQEQHHRHASTRNRADASCNQYRTNVDVWSLGCVLLQYVTGSILFHGTNEYSVMKDMVKFLGGVPDAWQKIGWTASEEQCTHAIRLKNITERLASAQFENKALFCDMLTRMFHPSGVARPSATDLLTHPFVAPYVGRTTRFMCSVTRQRPTFCSARSVAGRVRSRPLQETSRWAFQTSVDVSTELLDTRLGLQYTPRLSEQHRELMCDWLWEQNRTLHYNVGTALASIHNFDRFMSMAAKETLRELGQADYVLVGIICFYLTIHYYEQYVVDLPTLIGACGYRYEAHQVRRTIRNVLIALHFQVSTPSHWTLYCRHRSTMHMPHSMDTNVATLLYYLLRTVYFAASIPKAVLLMSVVERVRFNRLFEEQYSSVRLLPIARRLDRERAELRRHCRREARSYSTTKIGVGTRHSLRAASDQNIGRCQTRGARALSCEHTLQATLQRQQQAQEQSDEPRRIVTRSYSRK